MVSMDLLFPEALVGFGRSAGGVGKGKELEQYAVGGEVPERKRSLSQEVVVAGFHLLNRTLFSTKTTFSSL